MGLYNLVEEYCSVNVDAKSSSWSPEIFPGDEVDYNCVDNISNSTYVNSVTQNNNKGHLV